jgi:Yip1 domain
MAAEVTGAVRHPGLVLGVARFFHDPRASMRGVLESRPGEGRLLAYALLAAAILLAGRIAVLTIAAGRGAADLLPQVSAQVASLMFFVPLVYYGLAALGTAAAKAFGGRGGWRDGRAAFFWAALVSAPVVVLSGLAALAFGLGPGVLGVAVAQLGPVFFAWALAQCFAEAFGFRRGWAVFAMIGVLVLLIVLLARLAAF